MSPVSTRPSSITSAKSQDLWGTSKSSEVWPSREGEGSVDGQLSHLLDTVSLRAKTLIGVYSDKSKARRSLNHMTTRSHDNLSELQEKDEDEMMRTARIELKFPSELQLYSSSALVEEEAQTVLSAVERLKTAGQTTTSVKYVDTSCSVF